MNCRFDIERNDLKIIDYKNYTADASIELLYINITLVLLYFQCVRIGKLRISGKGSF